MFGKKGVLFSLVAISVLTVQLLFPIVAYADEGAPTDLPTTTAIDTPTSAPTDALLPTEIITTPAPTEQDSLSPTLTDTAVETALPDPSITPMIESSPTNVPQAEVPAPAEQILSAIPDGTQVVVLNEAGQVESLASQDAAAIIESSDPMWCPGSPPIPAGQVGCVQAATLTLLIPLIVTPQAGTIYFMATYTTNDFDALSVLNTYSLTLQGGWQGGSSEVVNGQTDVSVNIDLSNWTGDVTINNININNAGLTVTTTGTITLDTVNVSGNSNGNGATLDNSSSADNATVTVTNSTFTGNKGDGLAITTKGTVTLNNVTAGIFTCSYCGIVPAPNTPKSNGGNGVTITQLGTGNININGGNFSNNQGDGLHITQAGGNVNITPLARFNNNGQNGIYIDTTGIVTIDVFDAMDNGKDGVHIANSASISSNNGWMWNNGGNGATFISSGNIYINGAAEFKNNGKYGVQFELKKPATFFLDCVIFENNQLGNYGQLQPAPLGSKFLFAPCGGPATEITLNFVPIPSVVNDTEFVLDCTGSATSFVVRLPNEDRITILCPVSGNAQIKRLTNTMLPADLPEGYSYLSAFSVDITRDKHRIDVINDGGFIRYSFAKPLVSGDTQFAVLYWDEASHQWLTLPAYSSLKKGDTTYPSLTSINIDPSGLGLDPLRLAELNKRLIIGGTSVVPSSGRVEVSTNFPGIFVLVQK